MKVGDYVRTKDGIKKVLKYTYNEKYENGHCVWFDNKDYGILFTDEEVNKMKPSPNIMDLIEVGDFITYKKGNMYIDIPYRVYGTYNEILEETELRIDDEYLKDIEILSIVTHEQFEIIQYNLESEVN